MTTKNQFLESLGDRTFTPVNQDELLKSKVSERKRREIERQEEIDTMEHEAKKAELEKKRKTAETDAERIDRKLEGSDSPFKVHGEFNLGKFDLQEQLREAKAREDQLRAEAEASSRATGQENERLRDELHKQEIKVLEITFQTQMSNLAKMVEQSSSRGSFIDQYNQIIQTAKELGLGQPQGSADLIAQIELEKLKFEQGLELRRFNREEKRADREFQRQLNRDADEREHRKQRMAIEERKQEQFAKGFEVAGTVIAQALKENVDEEGGVSEGAKTYSLTIDAGQSGEAECPECQSPVGVGRTAKSAVCANCGTQIKIQRKQPTNA